MTNRQYDTWTAEELAELRRLYETNLRTPLIAKRMKRSKDSVSKKITELDIDHRKPGPGPGLRSPITLAAINFK